MKRKTAKSRLKPNTATEEARIRAGIKADPDTRELTAADFKRMRPFAEVMAEVRRGRPKADVRKVPVTVRLDPHVVEFFRAGGQGWQTRMNKALAAYVNRQHRHG